MTGVCQHQEATTVIASGLPSWLGSPPLPLYRIEGPVTGQPFFLAGQFLLVRALDLGLGAWLTLWAMDKQKARACAGRNDEPLFSDRAPNRVGGVAPDRGSPDEVMTSVGAFPSSNNSPTGALIPITGSPFFAGIGPSYVTITGTIQ